jgi:hypothetical protein
MEGGQKDTFLLVDSLDLKKGSYYVNAWISSPVSDVNRKDDTVRRTIRIDPKLVLKFEPITGSSCLAGEMNVFQTVTLENNGNMDISNIGLILQIDTGETTSPLYLTHEETYNGTIKAGQSITYQFITGYSVPWKPTYQVSVIAYMLCDSILANSKFAIQECTDLNDLVLVNINHPSGNENDKAGSNINIEVSLKNKSDITIFSEVNITALIEDSDGNQQKLTEKIAVINDLASITYTFRTPYRVPSDTVYFITVFIDKQAKDIYQYNDTLQIKRTTDYKVGINTIEAMHVTMSQNVPNPANEKTGIKYSVPIAGIVDFTVYSMQGQALFSKSMEVEAGNHNIEINTSHFAAGIYTYSMEFNGQRIVKKMVVKR